MICILYSKYAIDVVYLLLNVWRTFMYCTFHLCTALSVHTKSQRPAYEIFLVHVQVQIDPEFHTGNSREDGTKRPSRKCFVLLKVDIVHSCHRPHRSPLKWAQFVHLGNVIITTQVRHVCAENCPKLVFCRLPSGMCSVWSCRERKTAAHTQASCSRLLAKGFEHNRHWTHRHQAYAASTPYWR